jgi:hypothetical protein
MQRRSCHPRRPPHSVFRSRLTRSTFKRPLYVTSAFRMISRRRKSHANEGRPVRTMRAGKKRRQHPKMCEVAHTSNRIGKAIRHTAPRSLGSVGDTEGAMPRYDLWWCRILPRIELDQRSREPRLQLERIEWLLISPAAGKRRLFGDGRGGDGTLQRGRIRRLLKARSSRCLKYEKAISLV